MNRPRVIVTDARRGSALAVIRSLGRRGWHVTAADETRLSPGLHSRYAAGRLRYPSPSRAPDAAAGELIEATRRLGIDLLIPVTEDIILPLNAAWPRETAVGQLAVAPTAALEVAWDKWQTIQLAERLGVPVPRGALVRGAVEAARAAADFRWPVVVKPRRSRIYRPGRPLRRLEVRYARDEEQLRLLVSEAAGETDLIVQELCHGEGNGVELLLHEGRALAAFQHRRLREVPPTGGASAYRESVALDPTLLDYSLRLLEELRWTGLAMVEFKLTAAGPKLMEINGRIWGSLPLAVASGMDFPYLMARLLLKGRDNPAVPPKTDYAIGVRSHDLGLEASWIATTLLRRRLAPGLAFPRRRDVLAAAATLFRPGDRWDVRAWQDPLPLAVEGLRLAKLLAERATGRSAEAGGEPADGPLV